MRQDRGHRADALRADADGWRLVPGWGRFARYLWLGAAIAVLFVTVYGGLNWLTSLRADRLHLYLGWETAIPFVPAMIPVYGSLLALLLLPPFALSPEALGELAWRFAAATLIAAAAFALVPTQLGFARAESPGAYGPAYRLILVLDLPHNLVPSLHVAYSTLVTTALAAPSGARVRALLGLWLGAICLSTLLVHQHHLLDVASGLALGLWLHRHPRGRPHVPG